MYLQDCFQCRQYPDCQQCFSKFIGYSSYIHPKSSAQNVIMHSSICLELWNTSFEEKKNSLNRMRGSFLFSLFSSPHLFFFFFFQVPLGRRAEQKYFETGKQSCLICPCFIFLILWALFLITLTMICIGDKLSLYKSFQYFSDNMLFRKLKL